MTSHYGISIIPDAQKNAMNVVLALRANEDPTQSENISQPASATGSDPATHWFGGRQYSDAELLVLQDPGNHIPDADWPVAGVSGDVSLADAQAACAALYTMVHSAESFTTGLAAQTLSSALGALGLQRVADEC